MLAARRRWSLPTGLLSTRSTFGCVFPHESSQADAAQEAIEANGDLDLPSQRKILAEFRCKTRSKECLDRFSSTPLRQLQVPLEWERCAAPDDVGKLCLKWAGAVNTARKHALGLLSWRWLWH